MKKYRIIWTWVILLLSACVHKTTEQRYVGYINDPDNKIVQHITVGEVTATSKWLPAEYRQIMSRSTTEDDADDGYYYFNVKFDKTKGDKPAQDKVLYLAFDMQKDFSLTTNHVAVAPAICQKIENGIGGSYEYMLAFEKKGLPAWNDVFRLVYEDKVFGIGTLAFVYAQKDIAKIPGLKKDNYQ